MNDVLVQSLVTVRQRIAQCLQDIAHTNYGSSAFREADMYRLGRDQGFLLGLEEADKILEGIIEMNDI